MSSSLAWSDDTAQSVGHQYGEVTVADNGTVIQGNVVTNNYYHASNTVRRYKGEYHVVSPAGRASGIQDELNGESTDPSTSVAIDANPVFSTSTTKKDILRELQFDGMGMKKNQVRPEALCDHEWIWSTSFPDWLIDSSEPYWISGKPGSGKSKLLAYLLHSKRTLEQLESRGARFKVIDYFFDYRAGRGESNSIDGMLRAFLYQLADEIPETRHRLQELLGTKRLDLHSTQNLLDNVCKSLNMSEFKICTFIDGIDEYADDVFEVVQICRLLVEHTGMKLCVASRPEVRISDTLRMKPHLLMEDHNRASMLSYAESRILQESGSDIDFSRRLSTSLMNEIIRKAEGIILWFRLVFDKAVAISKEDASMQRVFAFVNDSPPGLESLYNRILELVSRKSRQEAALILLLVSEQEQFAKVVLPTNRRGIAMVYQYSYVPSRPDFDDLMEVRSFLINKYGPAIGLQPLEDRLKLRSRIAMLLHGLVEVHGETDGAESCNRTRLQLRFIHATLSTYLNTMDWVAQNLHPLLKEKFPDWFMLRYTVLTFVEAAVDRAGPPQILQNCVHEMHATHKTIQNVHQRRWKQVAASIIRLMIWVLNGERSSFAALWRATTDPQVIEYALAQRGFRAYLERRLCLSRAVPFELPLKWRERPNTIDYALLYILLQAMSYERTECRSSMHIIAPAMRTYLAPCLGMVYLSDLQPRFDVALAYLDDLQSLEIIDLIIAVMANLSLYFSERVAHLRLSGHQQRVLGILILRQCPAAHERFEDERRVERFLIRDALGTRAFSSESLCIFMDTTSCVKRSARHAKALNNFLKPDELHMTEDVHHNHCKHWRSRYGLLIDWAQLISRCRNEECVESMSPTDQYREILELLLKAGADVNALCYPGGNVLNALLDFSLLPHDYERYPCPLLWKFFALVKCGIDPQIRFRTGNSLRAARRLDRKLRKRWIPRLGHKWYHKFVKEVGDTFCVGSSPKLYSAGTFNYIRDVSSIIKQLEFYEKHGRWDPKMWLVEQPPRHIGMESGQDDERRDETEHEPWNDEANHETNADGSHGSDGGSRETQLSVQGDRHANIDRHIETGPDDSTCHNNEPIQETTFV